MARSAAEPSDRSRPDRKRSRVREAVERVAGQTFQVDQPPKRARAAKSAPAKVRTHAASQAIPTNLLYSGDNLSVLRDSSRIPTESVDLIYLDPPFNSQREYNIIFADESGRTSDAQQVAFDDTWRWGPSAERHYAEILASDLHQGRVTRGLSEIMSALRSTLQGSQMMAYLVEMAVRLVELHRVLKQDGSLYLHCDPTASHYLRTILDAIFGAANFRNEVVWRRTNAHNDAHRFGRIHDRLLFYVKSENAVWHGATVPKNSDYIKKYYRYADPDGRRWKSGDATAPGGRGPLYEWNGHTRHWRYTKENMQKLHDEGRLYYTPRGIARVKDYLPEESLMPVQDIWDDDPTRYIVSWSDEGLGYPTQKPKGLLARIISASSNPDAVVLDPFCGCGTAIITAHELGRRWIGIDISYMAIAVMQGRLAHECELDDVPIDGRPREVEGAMQLANSPGGEYQFQWWILTELNALPPRNIRQKGSDRGIDGEITFMDERGTLQRVLISVKSGHVEPSMVRDLRGAMERERAAMGIFVTLRPATKEMIREANLAGRYVAWERDYPRIRILTVEQLLKDRPHDMLPPLVIAGGQSEARPRQRRHDGQQELFGTHAG